MKLLLLLPLLFTASFPKQMPGKYFDTYCNARFGYCINYPVFLIPKAESENGDGRVFVNKEGVTVVTVYGTLNQDANGNPIALKRQYELDVQRLSQSKAVITYQKLGQNFYVVSGQKNKKIFYRKMIGKGDAYCYAILEYNRMEKNIYDSVSVAIFKSFK
jgi:hypothetical protein